MAPTLPIILQWIETDQSGRKCVVSVKIEQTNDRDFYPPDGIKSVFMVKREKRMGEENFETIILIDNHAPFGFHEHPNLPDESKVRQSIHVSNWQEAWFSFEIKMKELLDEA